MDSNVTMTVLYIGVLGVIFYVLIIRPQSKQRKEHADLVDSLVAGDQVVTAGGLYGRIRSVTEDTVDIEVTDGVVVTVARMAISRKAEG